MAVTEGDLVEDKHAVASGDERRNLVSAEVVPGGRSAEQWRWGGRRVAPVEVVDAQRPSGLVRHLGVMRLERAVE